jgi:hypothetical protein
MCFCCAPAEVVEHIIRRCGSILKKHGENDEYKYWVEWLGETMGNLPDADWEKMKKLVKKNDQLHRDMFNYGL